MHLPFVVILFGVALPVLEFEDDPADLDLITRLGTRFSKSCVDSEPVQTLGREISSFRNGQVSQGDRSLRSLAFDEPPPAAPPNGEARPDRLVENEARTMSLSSRFVIDQVGNRMDEPIETCAVQRTDHDDRLADRAFQGLTMQFHTQVCFVENNHARPYDELRIVVVKLRNQNSMLRSRLVIGHRRRIQQHHQDRGTFDVAQEFLAETLP